MNLHTGNLEGSRLGYRTRGEAGVRREGDPASTSPLTRRLWRPCARSARSLSSLVGRSETLKILIVAGAYLVTAKGGVGLAIGVPRIAAVWPPTGLALASMLIWGWRMWPGVALGSLAANLTAGAPIVTAAGVTIGNTLEALFAVYLLSLVPGFHRSLDRIGDVVALLVAALLSTLVSATIGVLSLEAGGVIPSFSASIWRTWWLGHACGDLLIAPTVLVIVLGLGAWRERREPISGRLIAQAAAVTALLFGAGVAVFGTGSGRAYVLFPLVFFVSLRFRQVGAVLSGILLSAVAVWFTAHGHGPFTGGTPDINLLRAQTFVGVVTLTALLVAAVHTERERAVAELVLSEQLSAELERRVRERTRELSAANQELEAFSYSVSHDLRAPLRAIDGFSRVVLTHHSATLDQGGREMLERVRRATKRMSQLIDELLDLSRLTRKPLRREKVDLTRAATEITESLRAEEPTRDVSVRIDDCMVVDGDPELLRTLLQNLLENAWKFTAATLDARIEFHRLADDGSFVIQDNGVGFDMQFAGRLFRPFERLHSKQEFPGSGVGLTTVQRIVNRHGGEIHAHAEVGAGAAFYFSLAGGSDQ